MDKVAVLIPCYNESLTIEKVVNDIRIALPDAIVYVYDNNSDDGTDDIARSAGAIVRYEYKQGKGHVIRRMLREIDANCYFLIDGDDTYPIDNMHDMANKILCGKVDMVIADRLSSTYFSENKRPFHNIGNIIVRKLINFLFKSNIVDIMTGYRAFNYLFAKTFSVLSAGFEIETEMTIHAIDKNMQVESIAINYRNRPEGSMSKLNTYSDGLKVIKTIFSLFKNYRPLHFFGYIALILTLISISVFIPSILIPYARTGQVANFPTLIVIGFTVIAALLSFYSGMILSTIRQKNKQDYEFNLRYIYDKYKHINGNNE